MSPRRGTAPPRGTRTWPFCRAPGSGRAPSSRGRGRPHFSRQGVRAARSSLAHSVARGSERWAPGWEGAPGVRGRAEPQGPGRQRGRRPGVSAHGRRSAQALPVRQLVGPSVCAPGQRGRAESRGKRAPLTCSRWRLGSETEARPLGSFSWASSPRREPRVPSGIARGS